MANLIDTSYFVGDIEIPNISQAEIAANVNESIVKYEREVLIALLGYALYKELTEHVIVPGDKFDKLINGDDFEFTINGVAVPARWDGLKGFNKKSLIAYYVYKAYRRKTQSYMAANNIEVQAKTENSEKFDMYSKLVDIWNEFIKMYGSGCIEEDYGLPNTYYTHHDYLPSAYNYLLVKRADFVNWHYTSQGGKINIFGI